jgi:hypothetical protein
VHVRVIVTVVVVCTVSIEIYSMISCSRQSLIKTATAEFQQRTLVFYNHNCCNIGTAVKRVPMCLVRLAILMQNC